MRIDAVAKVAINRLEKEDLLGNRL